METFLNQDPRSSFINFIVKNMFTIEGYLYLSTRILSAIRPLICLIASLDKDSKEKLNKEYEELLSFERNTNLCSREKMYRIYYDILTHLQETYLIAFRRQRLEKEDLDKMEGDEP